MRLDKTMAKIKGEVMFGNGGGEGNTDLKPPVVSPGPLKTENELVSVLDVQCVCVHVHCVFFENSIFYAFTFRLLKM